MNAISAFLNEWFIQNQRELPWRASKDPYIIWLSEVILQQTRVDQGIAYFYKFKKQWPSLRSLAKADEQEVLKLWQGLGYYSRARNMLKTAKLIAEKYNGIFPSDYETIRKLPGIGPYTAAAIASIAFDLPFAAIDGNVIRLITRVYGIEEAVDTSVGKKLVQALADELLDQANPGRHNQAMMEFGALYCVPLNPNCLQCGLQQQCIAFQTNQVDKLPLKSRKQKVTKRWFNYLICSVKQGEEEFLLLQKRTADDIWLGLWEFPLIESKKELHVEQLMEDGLFKKLASGNSFVITKESAIIKHQLSHQHIMAKFFHVEFMHLVVGKTENVLSLVNKSRLTDYPLPRLIDRYLQQTD